MRISDWSSGVCSSDLNVAQGREHEAFRWFQEILAPAVFARGVRSARRMKLLDLQLQPENPQPHRYLSLFDFDSDRASEAIAAVSELARQKPIADGLLTDDAAHVYELTRDWVPSPNTPDMLAPEYLLLVMANYVEFGRASCRERVCQYG